MLSCRSIAMLAVALSSVLMAPIGTARADDAKHPELERRMGYLQSGLGGQRLKYDPTKALGRRSRRR